VIAPLVLEGTWDELCARAEEFRGCRLRLTVLSQTARVAREQQTSNGGVRDRVLEDYPVNPFFMTDECPVPFDLPRPGEPVLVPYVEGGDRLPEFPEEWRREEQDGV
jgi:hypothetical protein